MVNTLIDKTTGTILKSQEIENAKANSVLVIEEDYVNYLLINEILSSLKLKVFRSTTLENAFLHPAVDQAIDLLIVNISLTCAAQISEIDYLRGLYSVPIVVVDGGERGNNRFQEIVDWADGIISLNTDTEHFAETISDMLNKSLMKPVITK